MYNNKKIQFLVGSKKNQKKIISEPFSEKNLEFFNEISLEIFKNKNSKKYKDLISFAFWTRKKNLIQIKDSFLDQNFRLGLGTIFHLTPSNVPLAFAYSFVFGILSGNSNIVRVSKPNIEQVKLLLNIIRKIFNKNKFKELLAANTFIYYDRDTNFSDYYSGFVDGRIIWGSDTTIEELKRKKTNSKCIDLFFGDKYSLSFISSKEINKLNKIDFSNLIKKIYNDVFLMDQNGCSSPHLIVWEKNPLINTIELFWKNLDDYVQSNYLTNNSISSKKYQILNDYLLNFKNLKIKKLKGTYITRLKIEKLEKNISDLRGYSGIFFEYNLKNVKELKKILNRKYQTLSYFGYSKLYFKKLFKENKFEGVDRIVPIGSTLEMSLIWDGINVINHMSRIVDIK